MGNVTDQTAGENGPERDAGGVGESAGTAALGGSPAVVVVCGPPGVGKTTVAGAAATRLDATVLRTDVVRKELFPEPTYADSETEAVYAELLERSRDHAAAGRSVVLDGTFRTRSRRGEAVAAARECGADARLLRVECAESVVRERIAAREGDASDADFEIHRRIRRQFESVDRPHDRIDNSGTTDETERQVAAALASRPSPPRPDDSSPPST